MRAAYLGAALVFLCAVALGCVAILGVGDLTKVDCTADCGDASPDGAVPQGRDGALPIGVGDASDGTDEVPLEGGGKPDAPPPLDAASDGPREAAADASPDAGCPMTCNGACVTSCTGCPAGNVLCEATGQCGTCATCGTRRIQCFSCANNGPPVGTCGPDGVVCPFDPDKPGACPCTSVAQCPGQTQVCDGAYCQTCGGALTEQLTCKNGRICKPMPSPATCL